MNFETENQRQAYYHLVMQLCREKDCRIGYTDKGISWPKNCTKDCRCRQDTERAALAAIKAYYGH